MSGASSPNEVQYCPTPPHPPNATCPSLLTLAAITHRVSQERLNRETQASSYLLQVVWLLYDKRGPTTHC